MGILGEFLIIISTAAAGNLISTIPGFPLPGTVCGMLLMFLFLMTGFIKLDRIRSAAGFFLRFLPLFFIPLIINLIQEKQLISRYGIKLFIIILATTVITMLVTGFTAALLLKLSGERD